MKDRKKSKKQLMDELATLRHRVSKLEKTERQLKESEESYRNIIELAPDGIVITNLKGVIITCNDALVKKTGFSRENFMNKHFSKIPTVRARDIPKYTKMINNLIRGKAPKPFEYEWIHKDGSIHVGEIYISRLKKKGKTMGFQAITRDITEHKKVVRELGESEQKYRTVVERANDGIAIIQDKVLKYVNPRLIEISGYSQEELLGSLFADFIPLEERAKIVDRYKKRMAGKDVPSRYESRVKTKKSGERFVEFSGSLIKFQGKSADLVIIRDITERKKAEDELKSREKEFRMIAENIPGLLSYVDKDGCYRFVNKRYESWFGVSKKDIIGKHYRHVPRR
jgi:PAS domain S-box-containing protein